VLLYNNEHFVQVQMAQVWGYFMPEHGVGL
jgi:hypothetical protein